jgi:hypothetical protein
MSRPHSPYDWDVFVSYAHVNDPPPGPSEQSWVTEFVQNAEALLAQWLGRSELVNCTALRVDGQRSSQS